MTNELKSLTLNGIRYDSFVDQTARENAGTGGGTGGSGSTEGTDDYTIDYQGNILPIDKIADSYSIAGVTITHENGVFTVNGTTTTQGTIEITPKGTPIEGCEVKAGQTYTIYVNPIGGTATNADGTNAEGSDTNGIKAALNMFFTYSAVKTFQSSSRQNITIVEDYTATRFSLNFSKVGVTYTDYKIAPYVGLNFTDDYVGGVKKNITNTSTESAAQLGARISSLEESVAQLGESVSQMEENVQSFPAMFTDEKNRVIPIVQSNSADLRLIAFADPHSTDANKYKKYNELFANGCADGIIGLGDYNAYSTNTRENTLKYITSMLSHSGRTPNCFYVVGNHDIAFKSSNSGGVTQDNVLTKKEMYDCTCRHLNGAVQYNDADPYNGYYYVDYAASKIRMIVLNTSDIYEADGSLAYKYTESVMIQQPQVTWLVEKALDFSEKEHPNAWSVLICCHAPMFIKAMLTDILSAVKSGDSVAKEWTFKRRLVDGTTTADQNNPVTISANKDFSSQGAVDVIGILYGHDHYDITTVSNGIPFIGFISDNAQLDDYYVANVNGLTAGGYCFTAKNGSKFGFTLTEDIADASVFGYNAYLMGLGNTTIRFQNADGVTVKEIRAKTADYVGGMTEITGFTQERTPGTIEEESCVIVNIDKDVREIRIVPYGTGEHRVICY